MRIASSLLIITHSLAHTLSLHEAEASDDSSMVGIVMMNGSTEPLYNSTLRIYFHFYS
jgi:hypothetical protein